MNKSPITSVCPTCHKPMLAAAASLSDNDQLSTDDKNFKLPLSVLAMIKGLPSPNEYIEMICPSDERMNLRNLDFSVSECHSQDGNYPIFNVELSSYLKVVEALEFAQSVIKELIDSFEQVMPKETQLN